MTERSVQVSNLCIGDKLHSKDGGAEVFYIIDDMHDRTARVSMMYPNGRIAHYTYNHSEYVQVVQ